MKLFMRTVPWCIMQLAYDDFQTHGSRGSLTKLLLDVRLRLSRKKYGAEEQDASVALREFIMALVEWHLIRRDVIQLGEPPFAQNFQISCGFRLRLVIFGDQHTLARSSSSVSESGDDKSASVATTLGPSTIFGFDEIDGKAAGIEGGDNVDGIQFLNSEIRVQFCIEPCFFLTVGHIIEINC
ncbi:hypothetical protein AB6A40_000959 [Gnathostoma spinigerum]|uniref:Uncharacterized protein n=1 Tax=Gnathostoma spinigerum TaxID=75299 RepID=A0ABD6ED61_9BILA